jgi:hypothetical protein
MNPGMTRTLFLLLSTLMILLLSCTEVEAKTKIAFLKVYDSSGKLVQYEPNSQFGHTALQVGDLWLQSYPGEGVKLITWDELQHRGVVAEILEIPVKIELSQVTPFLGRPFDFAYSWGDEALYCSELLAKLLHVKPEPMQLNHEIWPKSYWSLEGQPGMSPDKLYRLIKGPGPYL